MIKVQNSSAELSIDGQVIAKSSTRSRLSLYPHHTELNLTPLYFSSFSNYEITKFELLPLDPDLPGFPLTPIGAFTESSFLPWMTETVSLPPEKQPDAVSKKLQALNPGFDGQITSKIENGVVKELSFISDDVADISPIRTDGTDRSELQGQRSQSQSIGGPFPSLGNASAETRLRQHERARSLAAQRNAAVNAQL